MWGILVGSHVVTVLLKFWNKTVVYAKDSGEKNSFGA